jgi:hypothetical protein
MICQWCEESIDPDQLMHPAGNVHMECMMRMVAGSVGHQQRRCSCFGGTEDDPPGMTKHEAAWAAAKLYCAGVKR